ncbi:MAG: NHL repeat-containing protein [Pirellulales bacterium]
MAGMNGLRRNIVLGTGLLVGLVFLGTLAGCDEDLDGSAADQPDLIWSQHGLLNGQLQKPRAMAISADDEIYIVDYTARIQVFTPDGKFLRGWTTPDSQFGRPTGLSFDREGRLLVANTHYYQVLIYSPEGELVDTIGGLEGTPGHGPGEFGLVTDAVQDSQGNYYVAEYGEYDRIQKFNREGEFLTQWGSQGFEPGQFRRPQNLAVDSDDNVWVVDACNHRVQQFDAEGKLLRIWGEKGDAPGQLYYPYDLLFDDAGNLYISEFGNCRVQKFTPDGQSLGLWGHEGRRPGELSQPWALVMDSQGRIHVLDTQNHRVQRIVM